MRKLLVDEKQVFGGVKNERTDIGGTHCNYGLSAKPCGDTSVRLNNGHDHGPSFANQAPNAGAIAGRNANNTFAFMGHPKK